jgi:hypothetical protein
LEDKVLSKPGSEGNREMKEKKESGDKRLYLNRSYKSHLEAK